MPDPTLANLYQPAVLWPALMNDVGGLKVDGYGQPVPDESFGEPVEIRCRWKWRD